MLILKQAIMTDLVREFDDVSLKRLASATEVWKNTDQGAATILVAALDSKLSCRFISSYILGWRVEEQYELT